MITFANYTLTDAYINRATDVVLRALTNSRDVTIRGAAAEAESQSAVVSALRFAHLTVPGRTVDQESLLEAIGFRVVDGKVCGRPCRVVTV